MGWLKLLSPPGAAAAASASDVTNVNAPTGDGGGIPTVVEMPAAPDGPDRNLSEEVKRRQVALLLDYVMAVRVR